MRGSFSLLPLAAALTLNFADARAAIIAVNDASEGSVSGKCTLTDALAAINGAVAVNACPAGDGNADTIDLAFFSTPTLLTFALAHAADGNSALAFTKAATIRAPLDGSGNPLVTLQRSTVSGTPAFRLLATDANLALSGLALKNGSSADRGGALYASGSATLAIDHALISGNAAATSGGGIAGDCGDIAVTASLVDANTATKNGGGIYAANHLMTGGAFCSSTVTFDRSTISNNVVQIGSGGGIYSFNGSAVADRATLSGNHAIGRAGGGVYAYQQVRLSYSTVSGNTAYYGGGGLAGQYVAVRGTTIADNYATLTAGGIGSRNAAVLNSTLQHNGSANYAGAMNAPHIALVFSTVTGNYVAAGGTVGGVRFGSYGLLIGSIVTDNGADNIQGNSNVMGNHNIIGANATPGTAVPGDTLNCDPLLGALANNGGPTQTRLPGASSCAIDAGPSAPPGYLASDQRGPQFARRAGAATDIGAVEIQDNDRIFYQGFEPPFPPPP